MSKLPISFYQQDDVIALAKQLLGKKLVTQIGGVTTAGIITETEAYFGIEDKACHAYGGRKTNRTATMYLAGGVTYVYLCYGIHSLLNVVTSSEGNPHAILIRGIQPTEGIPEMLQRRRMTTLKPNITAGPGALAQAMGIDRNLNAKDLSGEDIWIENVNLNISDTEIVAGPRIGVAYAKEHALLPWRFYIRGNQYVSKPNR